jgi:hypothetical protein
VAPEVQSGEAPAPVPETRPETDMAEETAKTTPVSIMETTEIALVLILETLGIAPMCGFLLAMSTCDLQILSKYINVNFYEKKKYITYIIYTVCNIRVC